MTTDPRARARELCESYTAAGDAVGWFEAFYREARDGRTAVPWADREPNPHLRDWLRREGFAVHGRRCLVVGCGLGDDAEYLAGAGGRVVAFDISPTAVEWSRSRFPGSPVEYVQADVLSPPPAWARGFDFVFEANTLQVLLPPLRRQAWAQLAAVLASDGTLLVVCRGREAGEPAGNMPWPLTRDELAERGPLELLAFEDFLDAERPPVRRFRAVFRVAQGRGLQPGTGGPIMTAAGVP